MCIGGKRKLVCLALLVIFITGGTAFARNPGDKVQVLWEGSWYYAEVLKSENGKYFIHYTGYDNSWDEWVDEGRIRNPDEDSKSSGSTSASGKNAESGKQEALREITVYKHESPFAAINAEGEISISGSPAGEIVPKDGTFHIRRNGEQAGKITGDGEIIIGGTPAGRVDSFGWLYSTEQYIGEFSSGNIWLDGWVWGYADVCETFTDMKEITAVLFFFTDLPEAMKSFSK